ncbi:MAG: Flp pilus assembly protein CpaB [Chloroflexi bacterium]|nr:MAG: Flp pilus assembly protein CpaB [Chloroflexota bacterium]
MQGRLRLLLIFAFIIVIGGVAAALLLGGQSSTPRNTTQPGTSGGNATSQPQDTPTPVATPIPVVNIVVAVQSLPRGTRIPPNGVDLRAWPEEYAPLDAVTNLEDVVGKIARTDIFREQPILFRMLAEDLTNLANVGSDAAAILPSNRVAVAVPMDRLTSVAYAIQDGDRVDVIVSMLFVDVDEIFQSIEPNSITLYTINQDDGSVEIAQAVQGRPDVSQLGTVILGPSEPQRPRLVTQRTIQDALVIHVGDFPHDGRIFGIAPTPTPVQADAQATPVGGRGTPQAPTPVPPRPDIITLGVPPQDAVVLTWIIEARLPITFALRSATDTSQIPTEAVTLDYLMQNFQVELPPRRPFALEPAITSIRQLFVGNQISLRSSGGGN